MSSVFKKSMELNLKIEKYLNAISDALSLFEKEIQYFLTDDADHFEETFKRILIYENEADILEGEINISLYQFMLLPDTRADVLNLIKSLDNIIDNVEEISKDFKIQKPNFPEELHQEIMELVRNAIQAAEALLMAVRAFFNAVHMVSAHINKVKFYETEVDLIEDKLNDAIFNGIVVEDLAEKLHLKNFVGKIAWIADEAETIANMLAVFTVKREI